MAHRILIAAYHMLIRREPFHDLGATYLDERNATKVVNRLTRRIDDSATRSRSSRRRPSRRNQA